MELIQTLIDFILHIDVHLENLINQYGTLTYIILFLIIFAETGLVVTPFLPGDSLLFAAGALAPRTELDVVWLLVILIAAAILGDTVNYWIGHYIGDRAFSGRVRFLKKEYLEKTQEFYAKHGGKTIILARFVPIVRTFAPFVAGVGQMHYTTFISYNVIGGVVWVLLFVLAGYFFGSLPFVQHNFELIAVAIVLISVLPMVYETWKARRPKKVVEAAKTPKTAQFEAEP